MPLPICVLLWVVVCRVPENNISNDDDVYLQRTYTCEKLMELEESVYFILDFFCVCEQYY